MVASRFQNANGGLNRAGRKHFHVKAPVKSGVNPRREKFPVLMKIMSQLSFIYMGYGGSRANSLWKKHREEMLDLHASAFDIKRHKSAMIMRSPDTQWYAAMLTHKKTNARAVVACCAVMNGLLSDLCVDKDYRRTGIGSLLVKHIQGGLIARVHSRLLPFYETCGFKVKNVVNHPEAKRWETMWPSLIWVEKEAPPSPPSTSKSIAFITVGAARGPGPGPGPGCAAR